MDKRRQQEHCNFAAASICCNLGCNLGDLHAGHRSPLGPPLRSDPQNYRALSDYLPFFLSEIRTELYITLRSERLFYILLFTVFLDLFAKLSCASRLDAADPEQRVIALTCAHGRMGQIPVEAGATRRYSKDVIELLRLTVAVDARTLRC